MIPSRMIEPLNIMHSEKSKKKMIMNDVRELEHPEDT